MNYNKRSVKFSDFIDCKHLFSPKEIFNNMTQYYDVNSFTNEANMRMQESKIFHHRINITSDNLI